MSQSAHPQPLDMGDQAKLANIYEEHRELAVQVLEFHTFTMDDITIGERQWRQLIRQLKARGAISASDTVTRNQPDGGSDYIREWQWSPAARDYLQAYHDDSETLPCGHRPHIHHRDDGAFGCKYCDEARQYSRAQIEAVMS